MMLRIRQRCSAMMRAGLISALFVTAGAAYPSQERQERWRVKTGISLATTGNVDGDASASQSPLETARTAEVGTLENPYADDYEAVADEGHDLYMAAGCNGCHGGTGGGGMAPPLTNPIWIYGDEDETLFRLTALGTEELQAQGFSRKGSELVVGPMPPFGDIVKSNDDLWKIVSWMKSLH